MTEQIKWDLILKHFDGTLTPAEEKQLRAWQDAHPENKKAFSEIVKIWKTPEYRLPPADIESAWRKCKVRADILEKTSKNLLDHKILSDPGQFLVQLLGSRVLKYAAIFFIIILTPFLISQLIKSENWKEVLVPNAQKISVTLTDNTRITLDAGSILRYPEKFSGQNREVYLNGEGYFEVAYQPDKPFALHANGAIITVLGTRFNVRAWSTQPEKRVAVTVAEGTVSLRPERMEGQNALVVISEGQYSEVVGINYPSPPRLVDPDEQLSWLNRERYFQNVPLTEVLEQLERWYDVEIILSDRPLVDERVTFFVENKSLEDILEALSLVVDIRYKQSGRKITLSKNN